MNFLTWCTVPYCRYWYLYLMKLHLFSSWLQDPYCAWDLRGEICRGAQSWAKGSLFFTNYWYRLCFLWLSIEFKKKNISANIFQFFFIVATRIFAIFIEEKNRHILFFVAYETPRVSCQLQVLYWGWLGPLLHSQDRWGFLSRKFPQKFKIRILIIKVFSA